MKKILSVLMVLLLVQLAVGFGIQQETTTTLSDLLQRKKATYKCDIFGRHVRTSLQQKGIGINDKQEQEILALMRKAAGLYNEDLVTNAKYIASKVEDSFGGKWNVEIFGGDPSWGRSTHIANDKWLLYFAWGDYLLDYIIWAPDC